MNKRKIIIPLILLSLFLFVAVFFAITQETDDTLGEDDLSPEESVFDFTDEEEEEPLPEWIPPGPVRWYRSNSGGMALEEIPSRLAALRNDYALVIDYVPPHETDPRLLPYYHSDFIVEIRVLYEQGEATRRQWLFTDEAGIIRLNAVFRPLPEDDDDEESSAEDASAGFIEIYNDKNQITEDILLNNNGSEIRVTYFYNGNILLKAETHQKDPDPSHNSGSAVSRIIYTDTYRYNRAYSLRHVERLFHEEKDMEPMRLAFPGRVLDAASNDKFIEEKLFVHSDFFGSDSVGEGFRMSYDTDSRGKILTQTLYNNKDEAVWSVKNTWSGERIIASLRTEGNDEKLTEYEYDNAGSRIVMRDINNGVIERVIYTEGDTETEELYLNGVVVLKAYWENGRKISEERVRY